jgi:hypothetical protein
MYRPADSYQSAGRAEAIAVFQAVRRCAETAGLREVSITRVEDSAATALGSCCWGET